MTTLELPEQQWPYRLYRGLRVPFVVIGYIAAFLVIAAAYIAVWRAGLVELDQSGHGGMAFLHVLIAIVGFIVAILALMFVHDQDQENWSTGSIAITLAGAVACHWLVAGLFFLMLGGHYPVPQGQFRLDEQGRVYAAGAQAPRGFYIPASISISPVQTFDFLTKRTDTIASSGREIVTNYRVMVSITLEPNAITAAAQSRSRGQSLEFVRNDMQHHFNAVTAWVQAQLDRENVSEIRAGNMLPAHDPWIKSVAIVSVTSDIDTTPQ